MKIEKLGELHVIFQFNNVLNKQYMEENKKKWLIVHCFKIYLTKFRKQI